MTYTFADWVRCPIKYNATQIEIIEAMKSHNRPITIREICNLTQYSYNRVKKNIDKFVFQKMVKYDGQPNEKSAHYSLNIENIL